MLELLLADTCHSLVHLDGAPFNRQNILQHDGTTTNLEIIGVLVKPSPAKTDAQVQVHVQGIRDRQEKEGDDDSGVDVSGTVERYTYANHGMEQVEMELPLDIEDSEGAIQPVDYAALGDERSLAVE